jgi:serine/threonine-protein kinase
MPPEQQYGQPNLSSDIYAVGIIAIQALTGILPHQLPIDGSSGEVVWRDRVQVSDRLAKILTKMVRSNYRHRFPSATAVLQALSFSSQAPPPLPPPPPPLFPLGKILIALIVTVGVGVTAIALVIGKPGETPSPTPSPSPSPTPSPSLSPSPSPIPIIPNPANFQTYQNPSEGIKIEYPQNWNLQEILDPITKEVIEIFSPNYQASLLITVEPLPQPISLNEYSSEQTQNIKQFAAPPYKMNTQEYTLAKRRAFMVTYEANESGKIVKRMEVWTLKNQKAYVVTYQAETGLYSKFLPTVETMINSLEIIGN